MLERYISNPGEHVYIVFVHKNLVRKMCPVSGSGLTLSTLNNVGSQPK